MKTRGDVVMSEISLENSQLRLAVDPGQGVNVLAFFVRRADRWLPVMPDVRDGQGDLKASSFVLIPYSNRIEKGQFTFQGKRYQLANGDRHASHGDVRGRAWQVDSVSSTAVHCSLDSRAFADTNWPWPFTATVEYSLQEQILFSRLTVTNRGETPTTAAP
jgi:aldose 1-epimerase